MTRITHFLPGLYLNRPLIQITFEEFQCQDSEKLKSVKNCGAHLSNLSQEKVHQDRCKQGLYDYVSLRNTTAVLFQSFYAS